MTLFKKIKHYLSDGVKSVELRLGPTEILVCDDNGVIPERAAGFDTGDNSGCTEGTD